MSRNWYINGPCLVQVKGNSSSGIPSLTQLGLTSEPIRVTPVLKHKDINLDAYGGMDGVPAEIQFMLAEIRISMTLIHFDQAVLDQCIIESMAGAPAIGSVPFAGKTMGGNAARFAPGNHYIGLNLSSPIQLKPFRFWYTYMPDQPVEIPLGAEKSIVVCTWRAIPYTQDPYGGATGSQPNTAAGTFAQGAIIWDNTADT